MFNTSIVILNWNGKEYLQKFLPMLIENTQLNSDVEIVVADNGSTDGSLNLIHEFFPAIRTISLERNYGFAEGYNQALQQIKAKYYILLNSDIEVSNNWLTPMLDFMDKNLDTAACQPKILSYYNRDFFEHAGAAGGFIDKYGFPFCKGRILGTVEKDTNQYDTISDIFWATGACLVIRSNLYWEVGGLDGSFFAHMEEIDLCWRLKSRGYKITCVPQSKVYHMGGGTLNSDNPRKLFLNFRNNLLLLYKNLPEKKLKKIMLCRYFFDYLAAFQLFITGKPKNAISVFKARSEFKKMRPDFLECRKENLLKTKVDNPSGIYNKSIVIAYYVKRKLFFKDVLNN